MDQIKLKGIPWNLKTEYDLVASLIVVKYFKFYLKAVCESVKRWLYKWFKDDQETSDQLGRH